MPDSIQKKTPILQGILGLPGYSSEGVVMELNGVEPSTS